MNCVKQLSCVIIAALIATSSLTACFNQESASPSTGLVPVSALQLDLSKGCTDYRDYLSRALTKRYLDQPLIFYPMIDLVRADAGTGVLKNAASLSATAPDSVSQTNNQEAGVDEGDIVKIDSRGLIYTLGHGQLSIVKGFPPEQMQLLSVFYQQDFIADELYIDESRQIVVLIGYGQVQRQLVARLLPQQLSGTVIQFIDVSNPEKPSLLHEYRLQGYRVASRLIGETVYLVSRYQIEAPKSLSNDADFSRLLNDYYALSFDDKDGDLKDTLAAQIADYVSNAVTQAEISELLPWLYSEAGQTNVYQNLLSCQDIYLPELTLDPGLLSITGFSIDGQQHSSRAVMNNAWISYATSSALYVAQTSGGWWWGNRDQQKDQTAIYKFDLTADQPSYQGLASLEGTIKDRFSLSANKGCLRVATSKQWRDASDNSLHREHQIQVIDEDFQYNQGRPIAASEPFGQDESIFSVRLLGDRGYVVTFRTIDPLFTFDLSDPLNPSLASELEIPGFSTYMHPMDDNHILTIGRGENLSDVQLQVFDVTDMANPVRQFVHTLTASGNGYGWSPALYDPHAFTYFADQGLLAIPYSYYDSVYDDYYETITAFTIDLSQGISKLGAIRHDDLFQEAVCKGFADTAKLSYQSLCLTPYNYWYASLRRAAFMTNGNDIYLYSISNVGVKISPALNPSAAIKAVVLPVMAFQ